MSYNEIFVPPAVLVVRTPRWWSWSRRCAENWPWQRSSYRRSESVPFPLLVPRDPSVFGVPAAGLSVEWAFVHPCLHTGTWICSSHEPRDGTDWTEARYEWVWQLPNEICSHSKPILWGQMPPAVVEGCFPIHSSATMASGTFFWCSWQVFRATRPMEGWYSWLWFLTCVCLLIVVGPLMVSKDSEPFRHGDVSSVVS